MTPPFFLFMHRHYMANHPQRKEEAEIFSLMRQGAHCFDVTDVAEPAAKLALGVNRSKEPVDFSTTFLPAPVTWLEYRFGEVWVAQLLAQQTGGACFYNLQKTGNDLKIVKYPGPFPMKGSANASLDERQLPLSLPFLEVWALLAIVNAKRGVNTTETEPHKGALKASRNYLEPFELLPWKTISLSGGGGPRSNGPAGSAPGSEAHRAYHFCRSHPRVVRGKVVIVMSHWRGDPAFGVVRANYKVKSQ